MTYRGLIGPPVTAVPRLSEARSSEVTPAPRHAACPSPEPGDDRRARREPGGLGAARAVTSPMTSRARPSSQNCSGRSPIPVMRSSAQASCSTSVSPNESAEPRLVVNSPGQPLDEVAVGVHEAVGVARAMSGSFWTSHRSLGNDCVSDGPRPVRRCSSSWPKRSPSSLELRLGAPVVPQDRVAQRRVVLVDRGEGLALVGDADARRRGRRRPPRRPRASARGVASHQPSATCSARSGWGWISSSGARPSATALPSRSQATTLLAVVLQSTASTRSATVSSVVGMWSTASAGSVPTASTPWFRSVGQLAGCDQRRRTDATERDGRR